MARTSKSDWWETALWVAIFILAAAFVYQLLKLWNAGVSSASNGLSSIGQALTNTADAVESFFSTLVTAPFTAIADLFDSIPNLFNLFVSFVAGLVTGDPIGTVSAFFGGIFGDLFTSPSAVTTGLGSSVSGIGNPASGTSTIPTGVTSAPGTFSAPSGGPTVNEPSGIPGTGAVITDGSN